MSVAVAPNSLIQSACASDCSNWSIKDKIFNEDCLSGMKRIPSQTIPMILTDIPYAVVNRESGGIRSFDKAVADIMTVNLEDLVDEFTRVCSGSVYIFCSTEQVSELRERLVACGWSTRLGIWEKTNPSPVNGQHMWLSGVECCVFGRKKGAVFNEHCKNTVWRFPNGRSKRHPTEKPLALFEYLIRASSKEGDLILDPFIGSGTSAEAAIRNKRSFVGFELDSDYWKVATDRVERALLVARGE